MLSLPNIAGRYEVGATTFALQLRSASVIGSAKLREQGTEELKPALTLEEVAFTAFYPAETSGKDGVRDLRKGIDWLGRPVKDSLLGYARFGRLSRIYTWILWPFLYFYGSRVKMPVYSNAPLLDPSALSVDGQKPQGSQWPLVIFSHGLGGGRNAYSQICSRIAASGRVVIALEHRDGTSPACIIRSLSGETTTKLYSLTDDVVWGSDMPSDPGTLPFRHDQLTFRRHEIYLAYSAFRSLIEHGRNGIEQETRQLQTIDGSQIDWESWSKRVKCEADVTLAGHSFGGATVFSLLSSPPPANEYPQIPVTQALILDPWIEPIPSPGPAPLSDRNLNISPEGSPEQTTASTGSLSESTAKGSGTLMQDSRSLPRMLVLNSDRFTLWKDHFERLKDVVEAWEPEGQRVLTLVRAEHASFSDFPLLPILRRAGAQIVMDLLSKLSLAFLDGQMEEALGEVKTRKMEVEIIGKLKDGKPKRRLIGEVGEIIIH
jgi:platelet-activating factor acetylhydrolase